MIKISKLADYAVVVLAGMSGRDTAASAADLSALTHVPAPTVAKVLKALAKAGIVSSTRGALGGYRLVKPADQISVLNIVAALDGPVRVTDCTQSKLGCSSSGVCGMHGRWGAVNRALSSALSNVSLVQLMQQPRSGRAL
jgi:FeS assembly SUF system regulator